MWSPRLLEPCLARITANAWDDYFYKFCASHAQVTLERVQKFQNFAITILSIGFGGDARPCFLLGARRLHGQSRLHHKRSEGDLRRNYPRRKHRKFILQRASWRANYVSSDFVRTSVHNRYPILSHHGGHHGRASVQQDFVHLVDLLRFQQHLL